MLLWRIIGGIGRTLITSGLFILLFVAYQLWGTGIQEARAQDSLADEFTEFLESAPEFTEGVEDPVAEPTAVPEASLASANPDEAAAEPGPAPEPTARPKASIPPEFLYKDDGEAIARISMPTIGVDKVIVAGVSVEALRIGPGHYPTTVMPGQPGNASIAGHRTTYGAPFHRIDELQPGDEIKVQTIQGVHTYVVDAQTTASGQEVGYFIVDPSATEVLSDFGDNRLTLTACHPKYSARQRIIVTATLVSEPVELIERPADLQAGELKLQADENSNGEDGTELVISDEVARDDDPELTSDPEFAETASAAAAAATDTDDPSGQSDGSAVDVEGAETVSQAGADEAAMAEAEAALAAQTAEAADSTQIQDDFGEGLNGDREAIVPAIMWGLAAAAIWLAAWFVGTKWRPIPMYAVGFMPFALMVFTAFQFIDKAIPSY